jgi:predicted GNAT family N-acyltransferase
MNVVIRQVTWDSHEAELYRIRHVVFVVEQGVPVELERDAHDPQALHLLALTADGRPVGTARMLADGHIGRMAVLRAWRNQGIGSALLERLVQLARQQGRSSVFLHAQCQAEPFYARLGFVAEGAVFQDAGIDHRCMRLPLRGEGG